MREHDEAPAPEPEAVTTDEAGRLLSVSRTRVYQLMARGELRWVKLGRSRRVIRSSITELLDREAQ